MKAIYVGLILLFANMSLAHADFILTTSCKQNRLSWKIDFKIDERSKTVLSLRNFAMSNGRRDGRFINVEGKSRVTFFKNGSVKYLSYGLYNRQNQLDKFEFYEMMNKIDMNGQLYAKCSVASIRKISNQPSSFKAPYPNPSNKKYDNANYKNSANKKNKSKRWQSEWTNSDGSKSQTIVEFFKRAKPDGRVGKYGWSNGRFIGVYINNSASFEGRWIQDKSGQRCDDSVDGSFYHGKVWFKVLNKNYFKGKWGYCNATPNFDWRGWID